MRFRTLLVSIATGAIACQPPRQPAQPFESNCTVGPPPAEASLPAGHIDANTSILPGGRMITPVGTVLNSGGYPIALRILPGDRYAVLTDDAVHDQQLRVIDLQAADPTQPVVSAYDYPLTAKSDHTAGLWYGMALEPDGSRLYVSNGGYDPVDDSQPLNLHYNTIDVFDIQGSPPQLVKNDSATLQLAFRSVGGTYTQRLPSGITFSSDGKLMYVACQGDNSLAILSLDQSAGTYGAEIGTAPVVGLEPYDVAVDESSHTAFISLWGGDTSDYGIATDGVVAVDVTDPTKPVASAQIIKTGKASEAEVMLAGKIYVVNADADTLSVIDAQSQTVQSVPVDVSTVLGATPNNLAIDSARNRIYVANANENSVVVLDLNTLAMVGNIPTAWYPTAVGVRGDGSLVISSARGMGYGPANDTTDNIRAVGAVQVVPLPTDDQLKSWKDVVAENLDRPRALQAPVKCPNVPTSEKRFPLAVELGAPSPLQHVFFIIKENKTFDSVLGDLSGGDPSLLEWPVKYTPNAHSLATTFVLLKNFYSNAELSLQGHEWTTGDWNNDYVEKGWGATEDYGRGYRSDYAFSSTSLARLGYPGSDSIWVHLDKSNIAYHDYGEITNLAGAKTALDPNYPGIVFDTSILDIKKEAYVAGNIIKQGESVEPLSYILFPNDHTSATQDGSLGPYSMVADNDEAVGKFVDDISHSPLWPSSLIIVVEDDPGDGGDHIEQHRSFCLMASPWLKRGYQTSSIFDMGSVYRAILAIVGAPSMNLHDQHAAGFYELFTGTPDFTPYDYIPRQIPLEMVKRTDPMREESNRMDFSKPDQQDLSRVLWKYTHGADAEPPWLKPGKQPFRADPDD